jgi:1-acyl-sn-glycerol-3-phosphate acyltransferase
MQTSHQCIPRLNRLAAWLAQGALRLVGWRIEGRLPDTPRYVAIGAPHTSFWDLPIFLLAAIAVSQGFTLMKFAWIGKQSAFVGPLGAMFRGLGGIPVNRLAGHHVVKPVLHAFQANEKLALILAPEGTRKKVDYWKPGFYYIARLVHVPIVCGFIDYKRRVVGVGPEVVPSGDLEADMRVIHDFYINVTGRHPERAGAVRLLRTEIPS